MIKAARYKPHIWSVDDLEEVDVKQLGLKGSPTIVSKVWAPQKPAGGTFLVGNPMAQVEQLLSVLLEKKELFELKEEM
jgi:electron transfer flavoprotein beta subunit